MLTFRPANKEDYLFIAHGFHTAMLMDDTEEERVRLFAETICTRDDVLYCARNTIIAEWDGERAGMITSYDGKDYAQMRDNTFRLVRKHMNIEFPGMDDEAVPGEYYLDSLAVVPEYRNKGIGRKLLEYAMAEGRKLGLKVTLAVDPVNKRAQDLYASLGFRREEDLFIFGHTYWKMVLHDEDVTCNVCEDDATDNKRHEGGIAAKIISICVFLFVMASILSCGGEQDKCEEQLSPLHDSISVAIEKMQWDECQRLIAQGEKSARNDMELYDVKLLKGKAYYYFGKPKEQKAIIDSLSHTIGKMKNGNRTQQKLYLRYIQSCQIHYAQYTNAFDSMLYYGEQAKSYSLKIKDYRNAILSISNLADTYRQAGDVTKAISEYDEGIRLNDSIYCDTILYLPMYSGMACSFNVLHNKLETEKWLDKMLSMSDNMLTVDSISYYTQKGNCLYFAGEYKQSLHTFMQLDTLLRRHPDMIFDRMVCDVNLADNYIHLGMSSEVGDKLDKGLEFLEKNGITAYSPYIHTLQILHLCNQNRNAEALALLKATEKEVPTMNVDHRVARFKTMALCYEKNGQLAQAINCNRKYEHLDDSLRNDQTIALTNEVENRYMRDSKDKQQRIILQQKDIKEIRLYLVLSVLVTVLIILASATLWYIRVSRMKQQKAINRIIALRGEIIRNRLTPHFISNALALGSNLSNTDIENIILLIRESLTYDNELTTSLEKEWDFVCSYIRVAALMYNGTIDTSVAIDDDLDLKAIQVPSMSILTIVENAIKHGTKDENHHLHLSIRFYRSGNSIVTEITNSGRIEDYSHAHDNAIHGLHMMQKTIELLNQKRCGKYSFHIANSDDQNVKATLQIRFS